MSRLAIGVLLVWTAVLLAMAQSSPTVVNFQGRLTDNTPQHDPIDATLPMEFRIYGSQTGSDLLWSESWAGVEVVDGIFSVLLGSQGTPLPAGVFSGAIHYIETVVSGETLAPRQRLASVPFSHVADNVDGFEGVELEESAEIDTKITVHDGDPGAHASLLQNYPTQSEFDGVVQWRDWEIVNSSPGEELQFKHLNGGGQLVPVMTLQPPTGEANVGIGTTTPTEKLEVAGGIKIGNTTNEADGTLRYTGTDMEAYVAGAWKTLTSTDSFDVTANVVRFGAVGDGVTDNTAAVQAAIDSLADRGGIVFFPEGTFRINGQLELPNNGDPTIVRQPPIKFQGVGAYFEPRTELSSIPVVGSILDLRYTAGPKIVTWGAGLFETDGVTFADLAQNVNDAPFIYTTNTTLHIHDTSFYGRPPGTDPQNDAIILGGTDTAMPGGPDPNGPFQGYATVIRDNFFSRIRRAVYGRAFCNGVAFYGNTIWSSSGTNLPDGAAIEIDGDPDGLSPQSAAGWYVAGNLIEVVFYPYGIKAVNSQRHAFIANNFYDPSARTQAYYRFEDSAKLNYVLAGFHDDNWTFVDDQAVGVDRSTVINFHQGQESRFIQKMRYQNKLILDPGIGSPHGPRVISPAGAELSYQFLGDNGMYVSYTPNGGSPIGLWRVRDLGGGVIAQELQGSDARIRGSGPVRVHSSPGEFLELGDTSGAGVRVQDGKLEFTQTAVQLLSGNGAPTGPAPNGSIYLRTNGAAGSTLYVRENGVWVAK